MKRHSMVLVRLITVLLICLALPIISAAQDQSPAVNGGLDAQIVVGEVENSSLPVGIIITNNNNYDINGVDYNLTASENGVLSGTTEGNGITLLANDTVTSEADLTVSEIVPPPPTSEGSSLILWLVLCAASLAAMLFLIIKKKKARQAAALLLCVSMLLGIFGTITGMPMSAEGALAEERVSFAVTKDVTVDGKDIRLTLNVSFPKSETEKYYTVSFVDSEDTLVKSFTVPAGELIDVNEIPILTKTGKSFNGWFLSTDGATRFFADEPIVEDLTVYPLYSDLNTDTYTAPTYHDAGFVDPAHNIVIVSESEITNDNLSDFAELETRFGDTPTVTVKSLGDNKYELSAVYTSKGTYCWRLLNEATTFDGLDAANREYGFTVTGEETEAYELSDELLTIADYNVISLEETEDEYVSILNAFGDNYAVGSKLGVPDESGKETYYKVTEILGSTPDTSTGKTTWRLRVTPCAIEEVYDEIDVNQQNREADKIIDISDPEDIANYIRQIETSDEMRVYADYIASAVNDSESFQKAVRDSYGRPAYIGYVSDALLTANALTQSNNSADAINEALELVGGIDISRPGVNFSISASAPTIKLNDFNSYWDERYSEVGEIDPKTKKVVNVGKTDYFGKKFASIETDVTISFSLNGGNKNIVVEASLKLKQYVKICSATQVKLDVGWEIYKGSEIHAGATAYTETSVDFTVTLKTDNGGFDISEEIDDIINAAKGEKYESDNRYIKRFRSLYDGSERDFIEIYRKNICSFVFEVGPVEISIPVAFIVRFGLSAGVGIGYDYRTNYTVGVYKEKNSKKLTPYYSSGEPGWEFNFYVAGHVGIKVGLNAKLGISITGCSKIFSIGLEAEFGVRADFYGYFLLRYTREWDSYSLTADTGGAHYFNTKIYFNLKLYASAFTFEKKWDLYSWEKSLFTSGNRYVLLDFNKRLETDMQPIIIPVTEDSKLTMVKDGKVSYKTVTFTLSSYFDSLKPVFFDLQKANEVFSNEETEALINQYTTVTVGHCLTLPNGRLEVTGDATVHLRPPILEALMKNEKLQVDTYITFVYNGPVFAFGDEKPTVTYPVKLVSQKYLTGERYNVKFWVDGELYQTIKYIEGTSIPPYESKVPADYCAEIGIKSARFDIPTEPLSKDMDLYAKCTYLADNMVSFVETAITTTGLIDDYNESVFYPRAKNFDTGRQPHSTGVMSTYFIGWDLEGDNSDQLNVPVPGKNSEYTYKAVYSELPEFTVTVIDSETRTVLSSDKVKLGNAYTIANASPPDDGHPYISTVTCESGDYISSDYVIKALSNIYPTSNVTLAWSHEIKDYTVYIYSDYDGTLLDMQQVKDGSFFTDPIGKDNWSELDYQADNDAYYEFAGWLILDGTEFVNAETMPITDHCSIYPKHNYLGIKHRITLLDEDGISVLFSGLIDDNRPISEKHYRTRLPDKEYTYELYWESVDDGSVAENATESGTYILRWAATERKYSITLDDESAALADGNVVFEEGVQYSDLNDAITAAIGSFVPTKAETDYVTYQYDGFEIFNNANGNGEFGICTVSFKFISVPKECAVTFDVKASDGNEGSLWLISERLTLQDGLYGFDFTLDETNYELQLDYKVNPDNNNYNFVGWSYNDDVYSVGDTISLVGLDTITLTAVYNIKPYAITLNTDGGTTTGNLTTYANADEIIQLPTASKEADAQYTYSFVYWSDGTTNYSDIYLVSGSSVELTAIYVNTLRSYSITFDANGGKFSNDSDSISLMTDYGFAPSPEAPTKADTATERFTFDGWSPSIVSVTGEATYEAKWKTTKLYTLTFDAGYGQFDETTSVKSYIVEDGSTFSLATVPTPYYNYENEVRSLVKWTDATESITVTGNATFNAEWSEPVSAMGILISDGENTEDIAASLANSSRIEGYTLKFITGIEGVEPFFVLEILSDGLTLSGNGAIDYIDIVSASVTFDNLSLTSAITAYGDCTLTVNGDVLLSNDKDIVIQLSRAYSTPDDAPNGSLVFNGNDGAKLTVVSTGGSGGIRSFDGDIEINDLVVEITSNEYVDYGSSYALGSVDDTFCTYINNSTLIIHKGMISGGRTILTDSTVQFDDNDFSGIIGVIMNTSDDFVRPDSVISLDNSDIVFEGKAYIELYLEDKTGFSSFCKDEGLDSNGLPIYGRFDADELANALDTFEGAWLISIDEDSSITVE